MIDNETVKEFMVKAGLVFKEGAEKAIKDFIYIECEKAANEQRYNDIIISIEALSDVGVKEAELYHLLSKFWNVESLSEATEYINIGRHLEWPYKQLRIYLKNIGYDNLEIVKYTQKYDVRKKLQNNPKLCELPDEKLKSAIEK